MCGIVGGIGIDRENLASALHCIHHRGPDSQAVWFHQPDAVSMAHARLAIIDLDARANQPMVCTRTGNVIVFNGELYNYKPLREKLSDKGWHFRTNSDTEVILSAFGEWGHNCLEQFNGMFAFVIYDIAHKHFFAARDRVGKKPLYYSLENNRFVFASEIKAILAARPDLSREINPAALRDFLELGYIPGEQTIFKRIFKVKPATYATFDIQSLSTESARYWQLPYSSTPLKNENEAADELEELLKDAIRLRLQSDVPVGIFLSGGLDSSLVAALAAKQNPRLVAYTARFPVTKYDESLIAARVANSVGFSHRVIDVEPATATVLDRLTKQFDEPLGDSSLLPTYLVSQAIRQEVTVALSGDGGDELFAGYDSYQAVRNESYLKAVPRLLRRAASVFHHLMSTGTTGKNFLRRMPYDDIERFLFLTIYPEPGVRFPLAHDLQQMVSHVPPDSYRREILEQLTNNDINRMPSLLQLMTRLDFASYLPDDVLVKVDRASMLASLEVRSPLLDYRIVEFAFRLEDSLRIRDGDRKYILKKVARRHLPSDFPFDRKQGFSIPESEWFMNDWSRLTRATAESRTSTLLDRGIVQRIQRAHNSHGRYGKMLFKILMLDGFEREYLVKLPQS